MGASSFGTSSEGDDSDRLAAGRQAAARTLVFRRSRNELLGRELFGEPAWDILLALYAQEDCSAGNTVEGLAIEVRCAPPTVVRWLKLLIERELVTESVGETGPVYCIAKKAEELMVNMVNLVFP